MTILFNVSRLRSQIYILAQASGNATPLCQKIRKNLKKALTVLKSPLRESFGEG
jgi:hypothetical protein